MGNYLGMFVDDDQQNYESIRRLLSLNNIDLLPYGELPDDVEEIYMKAIDANVDFIIIDYDLGKQSVQYTGIDVVKKIREEDSEIYLIYLTNKEFVREYLGEFDQAVNKKEFAQEIDNVVSRLVRALSRDLSMKNEREIDNNYKIQTAYLDKRIQMIKEQLEKRDTHARIQKEKEVFKISR